MHLLVFLSVIFRQKIVFICSIWNRTIKIKMQSDIDSKSRTYTSFATVADIPSKRRHDPLNRHHARKWSPHFNLSVRNRACT